MRRTFLLITVVTFTLFFIEALIHFNIGRNDIDMLNMLDASLPVLGSGKKKGVVQEKSDMYFRITDEFALHIPDMRELFVIILTVLAFSALGGFTSSYIIKHHF
jgi:hypothetical protein